MLYTLFFSRLRALPPLELAEYQERAAALRARAESAHPGFVSQKTYVAEDGERLTVVQFRDEEAQRAWRMDPAHREAQARGRTHYYQDYHIVICREVRAREFARSKEEVP